MTVLSESSKTSSVGDGVTTRFFFNFKVYDAAHIKPWLDESEQLTGFTVNLNGDYSGGSVDFTTPPADEVIVTLVREVPLTQDTSYLTGGAFPAASHERELDEGRMIDQQLLELISRMSIPPPTSDPTAPGVPDYTLPPPGAGMSFRWSEQEPYTIELYQAWGDAVGIVPKAYPAIQGDGVTLQLDLEGFTDGIPIESLVVTCGGVYQRPRIDYRVTSTGIEFIGEAPPSDAWVQVIEYTPVNVAPVESFGRIYMQETAPNFHDARLWWRTTDGLLFTAYDDGENEQWVDVRGAIPA